MAFSDIQREHVLQAIRECDRLGRDAFLDKYGFGRAKDHDNQAYDPKAILGMAHRFAVPERGS